jgi:hypothetical protein
VPADRCKHVNDIAVDRLVAAIDRRVRTWRRQSGNPTLVIPIYGPDGKTIIHTVDVDDPDRRIAHDDGPAPANGH